MRKILYTICIFTTMAFCFSCNEGKQQQAKTEDTLSVETVDSAVYGKIGDGSMMHTLEVVTDEGDLLTLTIDEYANSDMQGGMMAGDRITATYIKGEDDNLMVKAINLTTLLGRWTSLDRNFTINEDGTIESNVQAESRPYTHWNMTNARLVLNADTFEIVTLSADSLALENASGIFVYKRQK